MDNREKNTIDIIDNGLKELILNKKISARLLSLIEIIDKMILNQFFIAYNEFKTDYIEEDCGEPFELKLIDKTKGGKSKEENEETRFNRSAEFYEKLLDGYYDRDDVDKSDIQNENVRFPFDLIGTNNFLRAFLSLEEQSANVFFKKYFQYRLRTKLILNFYNLDGFVIALLRMQQIRNFVEHKGELDEREISLDFINSNGKKDSKKYKYIKDKIAFDLIKSLQSIFIFLPDIELSEFYQLIIAEFNKSEIENTSFKQDLNNIFKALKIKNKNDTIKISEHLTEDDKEELQNIKAIWNKNSRLIQNYKLLEFIKMHNTIGEFNITKIKNIIKVLLGRNPNNKSSLSANNVSNITFEEIYKIFHFFIEINEILRGEFVSIYERLNNYYKIKDKLELIKSKKKEINDNKLLTPEEKKKQKKEYTYMANKIKIKSKIVEGIRNNIAHSNLFFYFDKQYFDNYDEINYAVIFNVYISEIFKFYNIQYNNKIFKKIKNENETFKKQKAVFIKRISSFLLKKDYLFLVVYEESKNKDGRIGKKCEIRPLKISNDNKNIKEAFNEKIKLIINEIKDNPQKHIYCRKDKNNMKEQGIRVKKFKYYYFLKNILINELNKIKENDYQYINSNKNS